MSQVVCIVIPYFVAGIEQLTAGFHKPLVLCTSDGVYSVSESAAKAGIVPGTAPRRIRVLSPDVELRAPRPITYRQTFETLLHILSEFSNRIESAKPVLHNARSRAKCKLTPFGTDDGLSAVIYVDLENLNSTDAEKLASQMSEAIKAKTRLTALVGLAQGKFPARIAAASTTPGSVKVIPAGIEAQFMAPLSVAVLPIEESTIEHLQILGIKTLAQLASLPVAALNAQFGKQGILLSQLAEGRDYRPVIAHTPSNTVRASHPFDIPITNSQTIEAVLAVLADELSEKLDADSSMAGYLELTIQTEAAIHERSVAFGQPVSLSSGILTNVLGLFHTTHFKSGITGLDIILSALTPRMGRQLELFTHQQGRESRLRSKLRDVVHKYGAECFNWIELHPEARLAEESFELRPAS